MAERKVFFLMAVCRVSYLFAQLGRYSYGSDVTLITDRFAVEHAEASLPATLFSLLADRQRFCRYILS